MDVLIDLGLRAVFLALTWPLTRGLLFILVALYGVGDGWPGWLSGLCGVLGLAFWAAALWRWWRDRTRGLRPR
ncbi:hypothetical protein [Deinococcus aetherius]|nr:hypothetical protein [Deinococcus aetherius]